MEKKIIERIHSRDERGLMKIISKNLEARNLKIFQIGKESIQLAREEQELTQIGLTEVKEVFLEKNNAGKILSELFPDIDIPQEIYNEYWKRKEKILKICAEIAKYNFLAHNLSEAYYEKKYVFMNKLYNSFRKKGAVFSQNGKMFFSRIFPSERSKGMEFSFSVEKREDTLMVIKIQEIYAKNWPKKEVWNGEWKKSIAFHTPLRIIKSEWKNNDLKSVLLNAAEQE